MLWSLSPIAIFIVPVSFAFTAIGVWNLQRNVSRVATKLSFEPATKLLTWSNLFKSGSVPVTAIVRIERTDPGKYQIVLRDGAGPAVPFWFTSDGRAGLKSLTDVLVAANPTIDLSQILEAKLWWPGLEGRRNLLGGKWKHRS